MKVKKPAVATERITLLSRYHKEDGIRTISNPDNSPETNKIANSEWNRSRSESNAGRGRSQGRGMFSKIKSTKTHKSLKDYIYYVGCNKQASDYENTTKYMIVHVNIKGCFSQGNDIRMAIEELEEFKIDELDTRLKSSTKTDKLRTNQKDDEPNTWYTVELDSSLN